MDPVLLWLWCRLAAAALIGPLAWEPPYAAYVALKAGGAGGREREREWILLGHSVRSEATAVSNADMVPAS